MSNLSKYFQGERKILAEGKNKENNLSFKNIAANNQSQCQSQIKKAKVDASFKSICDQSSFYHPGPGEDLQEELNYVGGCANHPNKRAEYFEQISQNQYCKLCAAQLASLGYKLEKSEHFVSRDMSPSCQVSKNKSPSIISRTKETSESIIRQGKNAGQNVFPVKFSSIFSQKNRSQSLQTKYESSQKMIEQFMEIYTQKFDKIQELINDFRIKDLQYIKQLQNQNQKIYEHAKYTAQNDSQLTAFDIFGKSLIKDQSIEGIKFRLPSQQKIQTLSHILQTLEQITSSQLKPIPANKIPLIKSINSNSSGNNHKEFLLKNSSSISNLSSKSNFKKEKKQHSNKEKAGSEINHAKHFIPEEPIQSSRFSSNSAIVRKKNNQNGNPAKTQSTQMRRKNTEVSPEGSNSCEDTPESIKSKISSNSFVLPRNAAVTMFDKINVCESIDVKAQTAGSGNSRKDKDSINMNERDLAHSNRYRIQTESSYANKSSSNSVAGKERKSFHRYQNVQIQQ